MKAHLWLVAALRDPQHKEHESYLEWLGGNFASEQSDFEETNQSLLSPDTYRDWNRPPD